MGCCNGPKCCNNFDDTREGVSRADLARFGGDEVRCPECGAEVYHDAALCHACGHAMTDASMKKRTPVWVPVLAAGAALGMILMYVMTLV
jgi:ribosomal protein L37E